MKNLVNKWYRSHSLFYKVLLFLLTTFVIVYLFPKTGKFRFTYEKGKPWQSESLYAPFDFSLKKTQEEVDAEKKQIKSSAEVFINLKPEIKDVVLNNLSTSLNSQNEEENPLSDYFTLGEEIINNLYKFPLLNENYNCNQNQIASLLEGNTVVNKIRCKDLKFISNISSFLDDELIKISDLDVRYEFKSLVINNILPNAFVNEE